MPSGQKEKIIIIKIKMVHIKKAFKKMMVVFDQD